MVYCGCKNFCHRAESDLFLFLLQSHPVGVVNVFAVKVACKMTDTSCFYVISNAYDRHI